MLNLHEESLKKELEKCKKISKQFAIAAFRLASENNKFKLKLQKQNNMSKEEILRIEIMKKHMTKTEREDCFEMFFDYQKAMQEYSDQQNKQLLTELDNLKIESSHEIADLVKTQQETQTQLDDTFHQLEGSNLHVKQLLARVDELEKANEWISVDIEPEFGGEYNVVYDLEDGEHPLVTTMEYDKKDNTWKDTLGAGNITNSVLLWRELPEVPKFNNNPKIKILGVSPTNLDEFERMSYGQCIHGENMVNCEKCTQVKQIADNWKPVK